MAISVERRVVRIEKHSAVPRYRQLIRDVELAIESGRLRRGQLLPSVSRVCRESGLARETVIKAYAELKRRGIVDARLRRGYYVATEDVRRGLNVFMLFDEFTPYKEVLYNSFIQRLGSSGRVRLFFHHFDPDVFHRHIHDHAGNYDAYVVMPFRYPDVDRDMALIPGAATRLALDRSDALSRPFPHLWQDFDTALTEALEQGRERCARYDRWVLVFPRKKHHPLPIQQGFWRFCRRHRVSCGVIDHMTPACLRKGTAYLVIEDESLVAAVEMVRERGWRLGRELGLLSYNDTPMKRVVAEGISVVSIDFARMGRLAADCVLGKPLQESVVPTELTLRASL